MQSRFHLTLTVGLATCLGAVTTLAFTARDAVGYPAGSAVSTGTNPVVGAGGTVLWGTEHDLFTAPSDQDIVITDIVLSGNTNDWNCKAQAWVTLQTGSATLGEFSVGTPGTYTSSWTTSGGETNLIAQFQSGLRVPAGETARLSVSTDGMKYACSTTDPNRVVVHYAIAGYHAQP